MFRVRLEPLGVAETVLCSQMAVLVAGMEPTGPDGGKKKGFEISSMLEEDKQTSRCRNKDREVKRR